MAPGEEDVGFETARSEPAASSPPPLQEGRRLGRYRLEGALGQGAMATVASARDLTLHRLVAIKFIRATGDAQAARRLVREAQAIAKISHPNVVHVYDAGWEDDGTVYIAMEQIAGVTLDRWLATPRSAAEILAAFAAAGRGLNAAHKAGLVHRDFKPQNVMMGDDGRVRVLDFGLSCAADPEQLSDSGGRLGGMLVGVTAAVTATGAMVGTPAYMSPEQWRGQRADARSDQFSFCVALVEALSGRHPFDLASSYALRQSVLAGSEGFDARGRAALAGAPARLREALRRGLSAEPTRRFSTMAPLLAQLSGTATRRRRALLGGGVALLAGGALALAAVTGGEEPGVTEVVYAPPERLTGRGDVVRVALSPDEQTLAYLTNDALLVQALGRDAEPRPLLRGRFLYDALAWSPSGDELAVTATDGADGADGAPSLTLVDLAGGRPRRLGPDRGEVAFVAEDRIVAARFTDKALSYYSTKKGGAAGEPEERCALPGVFSGIRALTFLPHRQAVLVELDRGDRESSLLRVEEGCRVTVVARSLQSLGWLVRPSDERVLVRWMYRHELVELDGEGKPSAARHLVQSGEYRPVAMRRDGDLVHLDTSARWQLLAATTTDDGAAGLAELYAGPEDSRFAFTADGSQVAQISGVYRDGVLRAGALTDLASGGSLRGAQLGKDAARAAWSPDGKRLAVLFQDRRGYQLAVWHREERRWGRRFTVPLAYDGGMTWLDERRVGFGAPPRWREVLWADPETAELGVVALGGGEPTRDFARAPTSGQLAFVVERAGQETVEVWTLAKGAEPGRAERLAAVAMRAPRATRQPRLTWQHDERALLLYDARSGERWQIEGEGGRRGEARELAPVPLSRGGGTTRISEIFSLPDQLLIGQVTSSADVFLSRRAAR